MLNIIVSTKKPLLKIKKVCDKIRWHSVFEYDHLKKILTLKEASSSR